MKKQYYPEINGLRFWAALFVIASHTGIPSPLDLAKLSVWTFFILSGFLISEILLNEKALVLEGTKTKTLVLKEFYFKRMLRIFPLYYLTLLIVPLFILKPLKIGTQLEWLYTFCSNFYFIFEYKGWPGCYSHLWTIAVEEQYYLVWPVIFLITPLRFLPYLFALMFLISASFRCWLTIIKPEQFDLKVYIHTFSCIDFFGVGGVIAYLKYLRKLPVKKIAQWVIIISLGLYFLLIKYKLSVTEILEPWIAMLLSSATIIYCIYGSNSRGSLFLNHYFIQYLGKASYGIYLFHNFFYDFSIRILQKLTSLNWIQSMPNNYFFFFIVLIGSCLLAALSWIYIEVPILNLRNRYFIKKTSLVTSG